MVGLCRGPSDESSARSGRAGDCARANRPWVLAATILGSSMAFIDGSVVSVVLPTIQRSLGASLAAMQWVNNGFLLFLSALVLLGGAIGDRVGRRKAFLFGTAVFTGASIACGLAPNATLLVASRAVQGLGAAFLVPSSLAIIGATFPESERSKAIGTWAGASAIVTAFAPVLGGWLADVASWRAIFWLNVPIAAIAVALTLRHMPETRDEEAKGQLDFGGATLAALALAALAYGLSGAINAWIVAGGILCLGVFVYRESKASNPIVPLSLFGNRTFTGVNLITLLVYFALSGAFFLIPFYLIQVRGFDATLAGAAFLPFTILMGSLSRFSGGLVERIGTRLPLTIGPFITGVGFVACALTGPRTSYWSILFPGVLTVGIGMTLTVAPLTNAVMASVPQSKVGAASGINNAVARVAGLLAIAVLGAIVLAIFASQMTAWISGHSGTAETLIPQLGNLANVKKPPEMPASDWASAKAAIDDAFVTALRAALFSCAALCGFAGLVGLAMVADKRPSPSS